MTVTPDLDRVHLVGIGGAGMSGIARILLARGARVSGSDAKDSTALAVLRALGARIQVGHHADNLGDSEVVVTSSAIRPDNPELVAAVSRGLPVLPRAAALAALMRGRTAVTVAGTHGKTTTTSMLVVALQGCHADPSFVIGGDLNEVGSNAHEGTGTLFVAEADESDSSFLLLSPDAAIVTNVDVDHLDHFGSSDAVAEAFEAFVGRIAPGGFLVTCADNTGARLLADAARARGVEVLTYGESAEADLRLDDVTVRPDGTGFQPVHHGIRLAPVELAVVGLHNALDAAAAILTGLRLGFAVDPLATALAGFTGARRRFELKGSARGVRVIDDYAHNPTKVAAALAAARVVAGPGRVLAVFQPHLFSRTRHFATEFGAALGLADEVVVLEVYGAREDPVPGVSGQLVADAVPLPADRVRFTPYASDAVTHLVSEARPGDLIITLGAGDVTMLGPEVLASLLEPTDGA
ncbi:MAG TPA: UDP-N-acetylmuramate--L-alanine ligase [Mycobacteriales bacterium]|nr:UDP-N-acetylmuramate--L-alanine ligase [Mycobacteriales bacterium]